MTTTIALAGQKGGVGKSSISIHLAAHWHSKGLRVLLADCDAQASCITWAEVAAEHGHNVPPVIALGDNLRADLGRLGEGYDVVVLDLPGRIGKRQGAAMMVSDLVVLPSGPSTPDVWALAESAEIVNDARGIRPDLRACVVLNRRGNNTESRSARDALAAVGFPVLEASLGQRVAFSEALAAGLGVTAYAPRDAASSELVALANELSALAALEVASHVA